jgi:hypothetical protein
MLAFSPAYLLFECFKKVAFLWIKPFDWALKMYYPDYVNDFTSKKEQITQKFKQQADQSILSLSSVVAK